MRLLRRIVSRRRRRALRRTVSTTLRASVAGLIAFGAVMSLASSRVHARSDRAESIAAARVRVLLDDVVPRWRRDHGLRACPTALAQLAPYAWFDAERDPWGQAFVVVCSERRVLAASVGPDGTFGTDDDTTRVWRAPPTLVPCGGP